MNEPKKVIIDAFPAELEAEARTLHEFALAGSEPLICSSDDPLQKMKSDRQFARAVMCAAHAGFSRAQDHIATRLEGATPENPASPAARALYRCTMDAIAWQLIHHQLYLARRLYQGQRPPNIAESNFESV